MDVHHTLSRLCTRMNGIVQGLSVAGACRYILLVSPDFILVHQLAPLIIHCNSSLLRFVRHAPSHMLRTRVVQRVGIFAHGWSVCSLPLRRHFDVTNHFLLANVHFFAPEPPGNETRPWMRASEVTGNLPYQPWSLRWFSTCVCGGVIQVFIPFPAFSFYASSIFG